MIGASHLNRFKVEQAVSPPCQAQVARPGDQGHADYHDDRGDGDHADYHHDGGGGNYAAGCGWLAGWMVG